MCDANRFGKYTIVSVAYGDKLFKCHMLFVYCCHQMMSLFYILPLPQMGGNATAHFRAFKTPLFILFVLETAFWVTRKILEKSILYLAVK